MGRSRFAGITSRFMMAVAAGLLCLSYLSVFINPASAWFMTVLGLLFLPFAVLNLFLLLWALKRRSKALFIPLLALLPSVFFVGRYIQPGGRLAESDSGGRNIRMVTYNVGRFMSARNISDPGRCADSIILFLRSCDPDIICLQEVWFGTESEIRQFLSRRFRGYSSEYYVNSGPKGFYGNVTLSRFPAVGKGKIVFEKSANMALYTDYSIYGTAVRVYNCHLESYGLSLPRVVRSLRNKDRDFFRKTEAKVKSSIARRPKQVDMVLKDIEKCPVEAFVCGDLNDTPMSYTYYRMTRDRKDSFQEAGHGFGATYSYLWPMLRIDYMLCPESFETVGHTTVKTGYSDHYPVIADIRVKS